jgi:hypothetical protein
VFLIAANGYITCDETLPSELLGAGGGGSCGPHRPTWEACIAVPESQLTPSTIDLGKYPVYASLMDVNCTIWGVGSGCDVSGTAALAGPGVSTLTIESVEPSAVTFAIDASWLEVANGDYTAQRCP